MLRFFPKKKYVKRERDEKNKLLLKINRAISMGGEGQKKEEIKNAMLNAMLNTIFFITYH